MRQLATYLPITIWARHYTSHAFINDLIAAAIVAIMLVPQSLAYAMLAGLPAEVGLYASILPLIVYALLGTSSALSVGPVAITSLMTAAALGQISTQGNPDYLAAAITLAALSGLMLATFGLFKMGFLANFLSHSVVSAFITASALIIAASQFKHLMGVQDGGDNLPELVASIFSSIPQLNVYSLILGVSVIVFLIAARSKAEVLFSYWGLSPKAAQILARAAPVVGVIVTIILTKALGLEVKDVAIVGDIPRGLPDLSVPDFSIELVRMLLVPALMISILGYVESVSVGRTLGAKRKERIDSNQELIALGAANIASSFSGGLPVTGGFSRSVVNFDAGSVTQAASIYTALFIGLVSVFLTPLLYYLPKATLAATIVVAVVSLIDFSILKKTWHYSKSDCMAVLTTMILTLLWGVEIGVLSGVVISLILHIYRTSQPHIAEVGLLEGTEHFRNTRRYVVHTVPEIITLRVDESLFFANALALEDRIYDMVFRNDKIAHVILMCSAINEIDFSALETLTAVNERLYQQGISLHLSEVKGPVMDKLQRTDFMENLCGEIYLTQYQAFTELQSRYDNLVTRK